MFGTDSDRALIADDAVQHNDILSFKVDNGPISLGGFNAMDTKSFSIILNRLLK